MRQRDEELAREVELLRQKLEGWSSLPRDEERQTNIETGKAAKPA